MKKKIVPRNLKTENRSLSIEKQLSKFNVSIIVLACITLLCMIVIVLFPYATNQLWLDDVFNSETWGAVHRFDLSILSFAYLEFKENLQMGRMLFGYFYIDTIFYFIRDVRMFRIYSVIMFLINMALFVEILRKLKASFGFIMIFLICLLVLLRITPYYDPIAAFGGFFEALGIMLCASLLLLLKWYDTGSGKYLVFAGVLLFFSLIWYEINLIFYPIALYFVYTNKSQRGQLFKNVCIVLGPALVFLTLEVIIKVMATNPYVGTSIGGADAFLTTYFKQLFAVLPASYYWLIASNTYPLAMLWASIVDNPVVWFLALCCGASLCVPLLYMHTSDDNKKINKDTYVLGLFFLLLSPILIGMSARYQNELVWGTGYLVVYYQYFGLAILLTGLILKLSQHNKIWIWIIIIVISGYFMFNWTLNMNISKDTDARYWSKPTLIQQAKETGFLSPIQDGDIVEIDTISESINGNLIYELTGKKVHVPDERRTSGTPVLVITPKFNAQHFKLHAIPNGNYVRWELIPLGA